METVTRYAIQCYDPTEPHFWLADEPDDWDERREDAIDREAEKLLSDPDWIEAVLHEGIVDAAPLVRAIAEDYKPGITHSAVGGHLMDALWKIAKREASHYIDDGE